MAEDRDPLEDAEPDPSLTDEPETEPEDEAQDEAESPTDDRSQARIDALLAKNRAQGEELGRLRKLERAQAQADEPEGDESSETYSEAVNDDLWLTAELVHGPEAIAAYQKIEPLIEAVDTYADAIAVYEAYHRARLEGAPAAAAAKGAQASRADALEPKVDSNRSDRSPDSDEAITEARKSGSLEKFAQAATAAFGLGPGKPR